MPSFLVLGINCGRFLAVLHDHLVVFFVKVDLVLIVPLAKFEIALAAQ